MSNILLDSTLTCPYCGYTETETMPTDAYQYFYECKECGKKFTRSDNLSNHLRVHRKKEE